MAAPGAALVQHVRWTVLSFQVRLGSNQQASTHFTGEAVVSNPTELRATDAAQSYVYGALLPLGDRDRDFYISCHPRLLETEDPGLDK